MKETKDRFPQAEWETDQDGPTRETISELQHRLNRLDEVNREILILRVQQGLTYREIGAVVGLRPAQVKARCHRALFSLERAMRPHVRGLVGNGREARSVRLLNAV
jgi:RNA polymerase sigma factor (sigma-70 family)